MQVRNHKKLFVYDSSYQKMFASTANANFYKSEYLLPIKHALTRSTKKLIKKRRSSKTI